MAKTVPSEAIVRRDNVCVSIPVESIFDAVVSDPWNSSRFLDLLVGDRYPELLSRIISACSEKEGIAKILSGVATQQLNEGTRRRLESQIREKEKAFSQLFGELRQAKNDLAKLQDQLITAKDHLESVTKQRDALLTALGQKHES